MSFCEKMDFKIPYQSHIKIQLFVENAFLTQNRDFHGNSTDIESKIPLEYHCFRSEMIPLWFLNAKTTSPLTQRLPTHSFGYCFSNLVSAQSWAD